MDRVVVLGEQKSTIDLVAAAFEYQGVEVTRIERDADVTTTFRDKLHLLIVLCLGKLESIELEDFSRLVSAFPDTPIVPASFTPRSETALAAIRLGAFDWLILPSTVEAVRDLLIRARLHRRNMTLRKLATISQFSRWVAHEVRNPLSGILNAAQLLMGDSVSPDRRQRYPQLIYQEGIRIEEFLRRMTELGRSQQGPLCSTSLNAVTERVLSRTEPQLQHRQIQLERGFDARLPEVQIDVMRIELAVSRLIDNVLAAMPIGGKMTASTRCRPDEGIVELAITDTDLKTGPERERYFYNVCEPFGFREGGMGLAVALQIFAEHGGDISFRFRPDQGCGIVARLPVGS
jgi:signal transduction histidine kinase